MNRTRAFASLAIATALASVGSTLAMPIAHADPLDPIRGAVNGVRAQSTCGPLNYSVELEGEAQAYAGNTLPGVPAAGQYKGSVYKAKGQDDPEAAAINAAIGEAAASIKDCKYKDFGVGFVRNEAREDDTVGIALGIPAAPPPPPPPPAAPPPPPPPAAPPPAAPTPAPGGTVNANVDLYDVPGGSGNVIGQLVKGDKVTFNGPCPMNNPNNSEDPTNGWCKVTDTTKNLTGAVWGEFISK
jgi:hypothetical protein